LSAATSFQLAMLRAGPDRSGWGVSAAVTGCLYVSWLSVQPSVSLNGRNRGGGREERMWRTENIKTEI
jgi:hypothetical protein